MTIQTCWTTTASILGGSVSRHIPIASAPKPPSDRRQSSGLMPEAASASRGLLYWTSGASIRGRSERCEFGGSLSNNPHRSSESIGIPSPRIPENSRAARTRNGSTEDFNTIFRWNSFHRTSAYQIRSSSCCSTGVKAGSLASDGEIQPKTKMSEANALDLRLGHPSTD